MCNNMSIYNPATLNYSHYIIYTSLRHESVLTTLYCNAYVYVYNIDIIINFIRISVLYIIYTMHAKLG